VNDHDHDSITPFGYKLLICILWNIFIEQSICSCSDLRIVAGTPEDHLDGIEEPDKLVTAGLLLLPHFGMIICESKHMRLSP
jgi:hypothetical protein